MILRFIYDNWLWEYNPFDKTPKINGVYRGKIIYKYDSKYNEKEISLIINQSNTNIRVRVETDEITSNSVVSDIIQENENYVLYYTYVTNPRHKYSHKNPIQYGTTKFEIENGQLLSGKYWTDRGTKGDIDLSKSKQVC